MAVQSPPSAARKLFREEAQSGSVQCQACGGPITLRGFGAVQRVMCPYCGSELKPEDSGALRLVQQVQRQRRQSILPLQARGALDGTDWEILGIIWRECQVDGVVYPWQEFLLFNPYKGYRWLVYSMSDGHWSLGQALPGAPEVMTGFGHKSVRFKKQKFKHFQTVMARVTYVEGEFPWQVHVGDMAVAHEYIAPPRSLSIEEAQTSEGADVNFTEMRYMTGEQVWKAFNLPGTPPRSAGVGNIQPNPWKKGQGLTWVSFLVLAGLWVLSTIIYIGARDPKTVFEATNVGLEPITQDIVVEGNGSTTLQLHFSAHPLSNAWAYAEVMLVSQEREEAIGLGATAEEWHGVSGGESWQEGSPNQTVVLGAVPAGKYLLQITPSAGQANNGPAPAGLQLDYRIEQDIVLLRYVAFPLSIIFGFPLLFLVLSASFEGRRWKNSDYSSQ